MLPYPFNYFSSIYGFKKPLPTENYHLVSLILQVSFLISLSMIPVASKTRTKTYPLTTL